MFNHQLNETLGCAFDTDCGAGMSFSPARWYLGMKSTVYLTSDGAQLCIDADGADSCIDVVVCYMFSYNYYIINCFVK